MAGSTQTNAESLPLVLLAGRMTASYAWHHQQEHFSKSRTVITSDRHAGLRSIRAMAEMIAKDLPPRFDLAGWSMGGYIAFELMEMIGDRVAHLCLISTTAQPETQVSARARRIANAATKKTGIGPDWFRDQILNAAWAEIDPAFVTALSAADMQFDLSTLENQTEAIVNRRDARGLLGDITCPTTIIGGTRDTVIPVERAREIAEAIPGAAYLEIADAGHLSPIETPQEVNRALKNLLSRKASITE